MNDLSKQLDELFQPVNRSDAPGLVVGVAQHGKLLYRRGFGLASIEHSVANTPATRMRIGSTSKHFASLAALLLVEDGKLDIDCGVRTYLPELPAMSPEPTLRQFMNHTSGLRDSLDVGFVAAGLTIKPAGEGLAVQVRQRGVNFAPGAKMVYNNGGYHMLSIVIERVSGMRFEQFLKERIFTPLQMQDTQSVPSDFEIHRGSATMHVAQPDGSYRRGIFPSEEVRGEGAIVSTVDDMLRWLAHLRAPRTVGNAASWQQMLARTRLSNGLLCDYSLGLALEQYRGVNVVHHGGTVIGGTCQMLTAPDHALDIIIIANGAPVNVSELANQVLEAVLGQAALTAAAEQGVESAAHRSLLDAVYASSSRDMVLGFGDAGGKLGFKIHNSPPLALRQEDGAWCLAFSRSVTGPYRTRVDGLPDTLELEDAGVVHTLTRLQAPGAPAGAELVGRYHVPDLDARAHIVLDGATLKVHIASPFGPNVLALLPYAEDLFGWQFSGALAGLGGTLHVERRDGKVAGLRVNTLRTRHLHFARLDD